MRSWVATQSNTASGLPSFFFVMFPPINHDHCLAATAHLGHLRGLQVHREKRRDRSIAKCFACRPFSNVFSFFRFRCRDQTRSQFLLHASRVERQRLQPRYRLRPPRVGQIRSDASVPIGSEMRPGQRRGTKSDCQTLLQITIFERKRLRGGFGRRHYRFGSVLSSASSTRHRQVWRQRRRPQSFGRKLSKSQKAQLTELWFSDRSRSSVHCLLLQGTATTQHTRLSNINRRIQGRQEILQTMCDWTY